MAEYEAVQRLRVIEGGKGRKRYGVSARATGRQPDIGAWVITPGMVQSEIRTIQAKMQLLGKRIMAPDSGADKNMVGEWRAYATEWSAWRTAHMTWLDKIGTWSGTWDKVQEYKKRTNQWVLRAAKLGLVSKTEVIPKETGIPWSNVMWGIGLLLGLAFLRRTRG